MILLNQARYLAWRALDGLKGDSVYKRKKEIESCMNDENYYQKYISEKLDNLISFATSHTSFYEKYKNCNIVDFPVINKNTIMYDFDAFKSDNFINRPVHEMSTSGSTGRPFKILQDMGKRKQVLAEIMYFSELVGYKVGNKIVYLRNLEKYNSKNNFKQFLQNESLIYTQKYDDLSLNRITDELIKMEKGTTILGYASTLQAVSSFMEKNNISAKNVTGIISGAETITNKTRQLVKKQFNCPVVSRYSNQEMGILAQDYDEDKFTLNRASYFFEILDMEKDKPIELGQVGRIVITDLYNYAMPMIRYDTGDLGIMDKNDKGYYLSKIYGRKLDLLYTTSNEPLSFFALDDFFEPNTDIEQYQIIQNDRTHVTINLIMKEGKNIDEQWCIEGVKSVMGNDCNVSIEYLDTIPITNSGKFRYVICNYRPD